jgi:hypothetical protein
MKMVCPRILNAECMKKFVELHPEKVVPKFDCCFEDFSINVKIDREIFDKDEFEMILTEHLTKKFARYKMLSDEAFDQFNRRV